MRSALSFQAKRQLLVQVAPRYREAGQSLKSHILDEFVAATGYSRKYAIVVLTRDQVPLPGPISRPRPRYYGAQAQQALKVCWEASNYICAKRLVPFLPELVPTLERHGHLELSDDVRGQLLTMSTATADRILRLLREQAGVRGISTTKSGKLLKTQIPIRTFAEWDDVRPGFLEGDLVAHCGTSAEGVFLNTFVLTDVASGWTECLPLLSRSQQAVIKAMEQASRLLPFEMLGIDTDNGLEFINDTLISYCDDRSITFTRGRVGNKNDQCFVEQKNGSVVRQLVGYDRFEGEKAYRQLAELYRAVRLYVNFFQPSVKLRQKTRIGSHVKREYDEASTPYRRLVGYGALSNEKHERLGRIYEALDPVLLLRQIRLLQDALWRHAVLTPSMETQKAEAELPLLFDLRALGQQGASEEGDMAHTHKRKYHRTAKSLGPRTYRTRKDPFEGVWEEVRGWLESAPESTAKALFEELQRKYPGQFRDGQLRTFQKRAKEWRDRSIIEFEEAWLRQDVLANDLPLPTLRATTEPAPITT